MSSIPPLSVPAQKILQSAAKELFNMINGNIPYPENRIEYFKDLYQRVDNPEYFVDLIEEKE